MLANDFIVDGCDRNPLYDTWSICRASQTSFDREVAFVELALPSVFCKLTQPSMQTFFFCFFYVMKNVISVLSDNRSERSIDVFCEELRRLSFRETYIASLKDLKRDFITDVEIVQVILFSVPLLIDIL